MLSNKFKKIFYILLVLIFNIEYVYESKIDLSKYTDKIISKKVALTFDDGPHPYYTEKILEIISKYNIKATFFLVGTQIEKYPQILKKISQNPNCKIGNHTYSHKNLTKLSEDEIYFELFKTQNLFFSILEDYKNIIPYFRPPGGHYNNKVMTVASKLNLNVIFWSVFTNDHSNNINKEDLLNNIINFCNDQEEIILLHSGSKITLDSLEDIINILKEKQYIFCTIDEIINAKNTSN